MNSKMHDLLRELQWLIPALVTLYGVFDKVFGWGLIGTVETIAAGVITFIGVLVQHDSRTYFEDKDIVEKTEEK